MSRSRSDVQELYSKSIESYARFIACFQSPQGMRALLQRSNLLRDGLRILDAGCGFGMVTFALLEALRNRNLDYEVMDGFDLTPAMLARFQKELQTRHIGRVRLQQADVLNLEALPPSWTNYNLIISASMLEYLAKQDLSRALLSLRARLAPGGHILVVITRKTPETKVFIEWCWHAERYTKEELVQAFTVAGFRDPVFRQFPWHFFWLNRANYVLEAAA